MKNVLSLVRVLGFYPCLVDQLNWFYLGEESEVEHGELSSDLRWAVVEEGSVGGEVGWELTRGDVLKLRLQCTL